MQMYINELVFPMTFNSGRQGGRGSYINYRNIYVRSMI